MRGGRSRGNGAPPLLVGQKGYPITGTLQQAPPTPRRERGRCPPWRRRAVPCALPWHPACVRPQACWGKCHGGAGSSSAARVPKRARSASARGLVLAPCKTLAKQRATQGIVTLTGSGGAGGGSPRTPDEQSVSLPGALGYGRGPTTPPTLDIILIDSPVSLED